MTKQSTLDRFLHLQENILQNSHADGIEYDSLRRRLEAVDELEAVVRRLIAAHEAGAMNDLFTALREADDMLARIDAP